MQHSQGSYSNISVVELCGKHTGRCGYCKTNEHEHRSSVSFGLSARRLFCEDYQALVDRGWRRSGTYLYKPVNEETCCPCYTIRLEATLFRPSKSQRQVANRILRHLTSSPHIDKGFVGKGSSRQPHASKRQKTTGGEGGEETLREIIHGLEEAIRQGLSEAEKSGSLSLTSHGIDTESMIKVQRVSEGGKASKKKAAVAVMGDLCSPIALQLSGALHKARSRNRKPEEIAQILVNHLPTFDDRGVVNVTVAPNGFINFFLAPSPAVAIPTSSRSAKKEEGIVAAAAAAPDVNKNKPSSEIETKDVFDKTKGVEVAVAGEGQCAMRANGQQDRGMDIEEEEDGEEEEEEDGNAPQMEEEEGSKEKVVEPWVFMVETVTPRVTDEVFDLYKRYQVAVHDDKPEDVTREGFHRFLVQSPLVVDKTARVNPGDPAADYKVPYGSYHQLYRLNGKLIAVGVVDVLPSCLSSVYCFYDPDYRQLSLGKVTALWEIKWVQEAMKYRPDLKYYYLGFYIHTCPKMRYKGAYEPSELLCPVTMRWTPLSICRSILDRHRYARLALPHDGPEGAGKMVSDEAAAAAASDTHRAISHGHLRNGSTNKHEDVEEGEDGEEEDEDEEDDGDYDDDDGVVGHGPIKPLTEAEMAAVQSVVMDVGPLARLPSRSQQILLPILREYVEILGVDLAPRLMIKLRH